jgi:hypothetical protein
MKAVAICSNRSSTTSCPKHTMIGATLLYIGANRTEDVHAVSQSPEYGIATISLFDVLGFKDIVTSSHEPARPLDVLSVFRETSAPDPELAKLYEQTFVNFSDLVVRVINIASEANLRHQAGILFHELLALLHIQMNLLADGILILGAVVVDFIYDASPYLFGPGLIEAYKMESRRAIYPRIILDTDVLSLVRETPLLRAQHHDAEMEDEYLRSLICQCGDGEWFIDYLRASEPECEDVFDYLEFLEKHEELVVSNGSAHKDDRRIVRKYRWLARYHNQVISGIPSPAFRHFGRRKEELRIGREEMPRFERPGA